MKLQRAREEAAVNYHKHDPSLHSRPEEFITPTKVFPSPAALGAIHLGALHFVKEVAVSQPELCILKRLKPEALNASHSAGHTNMNWMKK